MRIIHLLLILTVILLVLGCSENQETESSAINVDPIDQPKLQDLIQNRDGKILLLNVWATWCVPCREEFPDLIQLSESYKDNDVEIVGISVDYPDEVESKIIPFLKSQNINFKIYVQNFSEDSGLINYLNPDWNGAIPATFVYDKSGKQRAFLLGKRNFIEFKDELEKIRGES